VTWQATFSERNKNTEMNPILQYWYFHLPNFVLAAIMYSAMGRLLLSFFVPENWQNYIWRALVRLTEPALKLVRFITPSGVPQPVVLIFLVLWLMLARVAFFLAMGAAGLLPTVGGAS
jgi:uncharacterized protein YggT (Ycf19 family)